MTTTEPTRREMRDQCIALEAAWMVGANPKERLTYQQIAERAIAKVDEAEAKGELDLLYGSWSRDPDADR